MAATPEIRSTLQDILKTGQFIKHTIQSASNFHPHRPHRKAVQATPPHLKFPIVEPLTSRLVEVGLSSILAERLSNLYLLRVGELGENCQSRFNCAYHGVTKNCHGQDLKSTILSIQQSFLSWYNRTTKLWADEQISRVFNHVQSRKCSQAAHKSKSTFNHEYIPLLEKFFSYNAYPSARDRLMLARKSMMEPRQIEVWFQNHRSRARKQGIPLRKLSNNPLPTTLSLESLQRDMPHFVAPLHENRQDVASFTYDAGSSNDEVCISQNGPVEATSELLSNHEPSSHAFPAIFTPPTESVIHSPRDSTICFPPVVWTRRQGVQQKSKPVTTADIEELIGHFQTKLTIRGVRRKGIEYGSWLSTTFTRPSVAPHPALVNPAAPITIISHKDRDLARHYGTLAARSSRPARYAISRPYRRPSLRNASSSSSSSSSSLSFESDDGSDTSRSPSSRPVTPPIETSPWPVHIHDPQGFSPFAEPLLSYSPLSMDKSSPFFNMPFDRCYAPCSL